MFKKQAIGIAMSSILCVGAVGAWGLIQPDERRTQQQAKESPDYGEILINGLRETDGCLKVITAETSQRTNTIIAWFENKAAVEAWYYSPTHSRFMGLVGTDSERKKPMAHVDDENIPVMVMASITFGGKQVIPGPIPASQISIELYTPLDAGAAVNGRLMPESIKLEHFNSMEVMLTDEE